MKRQFANILLFSALLVGGASTFVSCKDYDSDALYEANAKTAEQFKQYEKKLEDVNSALEAIKQCSCTDAHLLEVINQRIEANNAVLNDYAKKTDLKNWLTQEDLNGYVKSEDLNGYVKNDELNGYLKKDALNDALKQDADFKQALKASQAYQEIITNVYQQIADTNNKQSAMSDSLKTAYEKAASLFSAVYDKGGFKDQLTGVTEKVGNLQTELEYVKALAKDDSTRIDTLSSQLNTKINKAQEEIIALIPTDEAINNLIGTKLNNYYSKTDIDTKIASIETEINNLKNSVEDILTKQVSGIIVQASECPVTGYNNTPFGIQVGILGAYYGNPEKGFTDYNGNAIKANKNFVAEGNDNAGTIYVTINPANVNPTAITLRLVDSQGNAIASTEPGEDTPYLLEWANSDKVLKYGISRAVTTSSNGFYAVNMKLNKDHVNEAKIWNETDKENLKVVGKNILQKLKHPKTTTLKLGDVASTISSTINNRLTAYGLEASWTQRDSQGKSVDKKVTSKLGLATIAINPLSYTFLSDGINVDLPTIPTLQSKFNFDDLQINWTPISGMDSIKTSITLKNMPDLNNIKVNINGEIKAPKVNADATISFGDTKLVGTIDEESQTVTFDLSQLSDAAKADVKVEVENIKIDPKDFKITVDTSAKTDMTYNVEIPMDSFNKIIESINGQVGNMIGKVDGIVDKVKGFTESIDANYIDRINSFIEKFENSLKKANSLLQPALFYTTSNGSWGQLARVEEGASYLKLDGGKASTIFIASSYTAELLAPAYQKQISVDGGATLISEDKSGSTVVLQGNKHKVGFEATKAGIYTITYKARDYSGNEVSKKFYVKVVE